MTAKWNPDFSERMAFAIGRAGGREAAAVVVGKSAETLDRYAKGKTDPGRNVLMALAAAARLPLLWLMTGEGESDAPRQSTPGLISVPFYDDARASAGAGAIAVDESRHFVAFEEAWLRRYVAADPHSLAMIGAIGSSMEPTVGSGDIVIFDTSAAERPLHEGIFVIRVDDAVRVKRLHPVAGRVIDIVSDNAGVRPYSISLDAGTDFAVIGRVVLVMRRFK
ncbi:MAG TPA: S24 family peptidase [Stellaceae bacterium]|nr:S24 family peptidase [Stellaceae bacterium]